MKERPENPHNPGDMECTTTVDESAVARYEAKLQAKRERLHQRADRAQAETKRRFEAADLREEKSGIPMGQPILVGHHSERRHRKAIERANKNLSAGIEAEKRAKQYEHRAKTLGKHGISSDDPAVVAKLEQRIADLEQQRALYKKANRLIRNKAMTSEMLASEMGWKVATATTAMEPDFTGRKGFPPYVLTNLGANIRRLKKRAEILRVSQTSPEAAPVVGKGYRIEECKDDNRIRFYFDERPSRDVIKKMKKAGFRWSPTAGAWQRHLNNAGRYAAERMARGLFGDRIELASVEVGS